MRMRIVTVFTWALTIVLLIIIFFIMRSYGLDSLNLDTIAIAVCIGAVTALARLDEWAKWH
jgi:hypothetical protein